MSAKVLDQTREYDEGGGDREHEPDPHREQGSRSVVIYDALSCREIKLSISIVCSARDEREWKEGRRACSLHVRS